MTPSASHESPLVEKALASLKKTKSSTEAVDKNSRLPGHWTNVAVDHTQSGGNNVRR